MKRQQKRRRFPIPGLGDDDADDRRGLIVHQVTETDRVQDSARIIASEYVIVGDPARAHVHIAPDLGVRLREGETTRTQVQGGLVTVGDVDSGNYVRVSDTAVQIYSGGAVATEAGAGVIVVGDSAGRHIEIDAAALAVYNGGTQEATFAADLVRLGTAAGGHVAIEDAETIRFYSGATNLAEWDAFSFRIGAESGRNVVMSSASVRVRDGSSVLAEFGSAVTVGETAAEHVLIDVSGVAIKDGSTVRALFGDTAVIGQTDGHNVQVTPAAIKLLFDGTTQMSLDEDWLIMGDTGLRHVRIGSDRVEVRSGTSTKFRAEWNGNVRMGRDVDAVAGTAVYVFGTATTVNGETFGSNDILIGANSSSSQPNLWWDDSAGELMMRRGTVEKIKLRSAGHVFVGRDVSGPGTTAIAIFGAGTTYNSESVGQGDILIGDNSTGKANLLWDASAGRLRFRAGVTDTIYLDTDGRVVAGPFAIDGNGIQLVIDDAYDTDKALRLMDVAGQRVGELTGYGGSSMARVELRARRPANDDAETTLVLESRYKSLSAGAGFAQMELMCRADADTTRADQTSVFLYRDRVLGDRFIEFAADEMRFTAKGGGSMDYAMYVKGDYFIIRFKDGGVTRYKYIDLSTNSVTWQYGTAEP